MRLHRRLTTAVLIGVMMTTPVWAGAAGDERESSGVQQAQVPPTLRLTIIIARYEGVKRTGSLPFELLVVPGEKGQGDRTSVQTGSQVPVPSTTVAEGKDPVVSYNYRQIGTNIAASAAPAGEQAFSVNLTISDSQVLSDPKGTSTFDKLPKFQSFTAQNLVILRDGQTLKFIAATDKTSGEVIQVDVTLNVIK